MTRIYQGPADGGTGHPLIVEGKAVDAIAPGTLVERTAAGLATSNDAATVFGSEPLVAKEQGSHISDSALQAYTIGDTAQAIAVRSGEFVLCKVAAANNLTRKGIALASAGDGSLKIAATDGTENVLFHSEQVVNVTTAQLVLVKRV